MRCQHFHLKSKRTKLSETTTSTFQLGVIDLEERERTGEDHIHKAYRQLVICIQNLSASPCSTTKTLQETKRVWTGHQESIMINACQEAKVLFPLCWAAAEIQQLRKCPSEQLFQRPKQDGTWGHHPTPHCLMEGTQVGQKRPVW